MFGKFVYTVTAMKLLWLARLNCYKFGCVKRLIIVGDIKYNMLLLVFIVTILSFWFFLVFFKWIGVVSTLG